MKTFLGLVATINFILTISLIASFTEAVKTFKQVEGEGNTLTELTELKDRPNLFIESCALAFLMLNLGEGKYLPCGIRTQAVLHAGRGSDKTIKGVIGFLRLQQELITLHAVDKTVQPFTKVTVIISRDEHATDPNKILPKDGDESACEKLARLKRILFELKRLMNTNRFIYLPIYEELPDPDTPATEVDKDLYITSGIVKGGIDPDKIAMSMDIAMEAGKRGQNTAEKARLNLRVIKYLADRNVPIFLLDGRSYAGNDDFSEYEFKSDAKVYGVHTGKFIDGEPVQGLVVTDTTKDSALDGYLQTRQKNEGILVAHGRVSMAQLAILEMATQNPIQYMQNAFDAVVIKNAGYYKKN